MQILHKTTSTVGSITRPPWDIAFNVRLLMMMMMMMIRRATEKDSKTADMMKNIYKKYPEDGEP